MNINPFLARSHNYLNNFKDMLNTHHDEVFIAKSLIKELEKKLNQKENLNTIAEYQYYLSYYLKNPIDLFDFESLREIAKKPSKYIKTDYSHVGKMR